MMMHYASDAFPHMRLFRLKVLDIMSTIPYESILAKENCNNKIIIIETFFGCFSTLGSIQLQKEARGNNRKTEEKFQV